MPNNFEINVMCENQRIKGFEHEVLPYLIEAEALSVLTAQVRRGKNSNDVAYDPERAYEAAMEFVRKN